MAITVTVTLPYTFTDGPGNIASGEEVMGNFNALKQALQDFSAAVAQVVTDAGPVIAQDGTNARTQVGNVSGGAGPRGGVTMRSENATDVTVYADNGVLRSDQDANLTADLTVGGELHIQSDIFGTDGKRCSLIFSGGNAGRTFNYANQTRFRNLADNANSGIIVGGVTSDSAVVVTSDANLKENIRPIEGALDTVRELRGVTYEWRDGRSEGTQVGLIAQELERVIPSLVSEDADGNKVAAISPLEGLLIEAIKELAARGDHS